MIVTNHGLISHFYADDSQLYLYCHPDQIEQLRIITIACIMDIVSWMKSNRLRLNPAKTEFLWLATPRRLHYFNDSLGNTIVKLTTIARNLVVMMNQDFSMRSHINKLIQSCFYSLWQIRSIRQSLTFDAARKLICSLIHSRVDYCNSFFAGLPAQSIDRLQSIINASARLACALNKYDHITPALRDRLHWLPMQQRITYKLCLLTFKEIQGMGPPYIVELCKRVNTIESRRRLCSAAGGQLIVRGLYRFLKKGVRYAGPSAWNSLPTEWRLSSTNSSFCAR